MILGDIVSYACGKCGQSDDIFKAKVRTYAKLRRDLFWQMVLWKDTLSLLSKSLAAESHTLTMPAQVERVIGIKTGDRDLLPVNQLFLFNNDPEIWERAGTPVFFTQPSPSALAVAPASAGELLSLVSSNAADVGKEVSLYGESGDDFVREIVTLNGTNAVQTVNAFSDVLNCSKLETAGQITVSGVTSLAVLQRLSSAERYKRHPRVRLHETPSAAQALYCLVKRQPPPLDNDSDDTGLPSLDNALLALVMAECLELIRQYSKAGEKKSEGTSLLERAKLDYVFQETIRTAITPAQPLCDDLEDC